MALLGERVSAAQAEEWGLIWRAVPDEDLDAETAKAVAILKNSSPDASVRIRETVDAAMDNSFERQLELEMEHQAVLIPKNMKAGAKAFLEKRKPTFDGSRKG
jgi:2-(1,2-epoxy-1,2-dihydrophenyl)acetyl-CoA isomerase